MNVEQMQEYDKYFRALKAKQKELAEINAYYDAELERLSGWYKGQTEDLTNAIESIENAVKSMFEKALKENPKAKVSTPYGKVSKRTSTKWNWNEEKLLQGLKEKGFNEFVKTEVKETPMKAEIKKAFTVDNGKVIDTNGEVFDLVEVTEETTYTVKVVDDND